MIASEKQTAVRFMLIGNEIKEENHHVENRNRKNQ